MIRPPSNTPHPPPYRLRGAGLRLHTKNVGEERGAAITLLPITYRKFLESHALSVAGAKESGKASSSSRRCPRADCRELRRDRRPTRNAARRPGGPVVVSSSRPRITGRSPGTRSAASFPDFRETCGWMPAGHNSRRTAKRFPAGPGCGRPWAWRRIGQVDLAFRAAWNARGSGSSWGPRRILEVTPAGPRGGCRSGSRIKVHSAASSCCRPAHGVRRDDGLLSEEEAVVEDDDGRGRRQAVPHARYPAEHLTGVSGIDDACGTAGRHSGGPVK
jgi:hypothetical protein